MREFDIQKWADDNEKFARQAFEGWKKDNKDVIEEAHNEAHYKT